MSPNDCYPYHQIVHVESLRTSNTINTIKLSIYRLETLLIRTVISYCSPYTLSVLNVFLIPALWLYYYDVSKYRTTVL